MFYLMIHSTHFIYGYMALNILLICGRRLPMTSNGTLGRFVTYTTIFFFFVVVVVLWVFGGGAPDLEPPLNTL